MIDTITSFIYLIFVYIHKHAQIKFEHYFGIQCSIYLDKLTLKHHYVIFIRVRIYPARTLIYLTCMHASIKMYVINLQAEILRGTPCSISLRYRL